MVPGVRRYHVAAPPYRGRFPVTLSGPYSGDPVELSPDQMAHYRDLLAAHADDPLLGACPTCRQTRCREWRHAWVALTSAGELDPTLP